ncbi:hypothetical protein D3C74_451250 [compost metagenome]
MPQLGKRYTFAEAWLTPVNFQQHDGPVRFGPNRRTRMSRRIGIRLGYSVFNEQRRTADRHSHIAPCTFQIQTYSHLIARLKSGKNAALRA